MAANNEVKVVDREEDEDGSDMYSLFVCEDYVEKSWVFGDLSQSLLCSNMSSTDHDLTGQIVWPACVLLSWFIYSNKTEFRYARVLELGAGCGLAGFVAANYASSCVITDGNDIVVKLLKKNQEFLAMENVTTDKLLWGEKASLEDALKTSDDFQTIVSYPDIVIGADVVLWPNQVMSLLCTIRWVLVARSVSIPSGSMTPARCYISYIVRARATTDLLYSTAKSLGLAIESIEISSFVPSSCTAFDALEKLLLKISIREGATESELSEETEAIIKHREQMKTQNTPC